MAGSIRGGKDVREGGGGSGVPLQAGASAGRRTREYPPAHEPARAFPAGVSECGQSFS